VVIVDDHLAILAVAGRLPELGALGPIVTTCSFQFRMARAVADSSRSGSLSRRLTDPTAALTRALRPPGDRLTVLDPRASMEETVGFAARHRTNLLLSELAGAALHHRASIRVTPANQGRTWSELMNDEGIDFATVEP
jgi:hypothetical protein